MHPPRSKEEEAGLQLCICLFPLSHTANTAALLEKLLPVCTYTRIWEGGKEEKIRGMVVLCRDSETPSRKGGSTFPTCPKKVETSSGGYINRGWTCMVPVSQHLLEDCATSISAASAYRWPWLPAHPKTSGDLQGAGMQSLLKQTNHVQQDQLRRMLLEISLQPPSTTAICMASSHCQSSSKHEGKSLSLVQEEHKNLLNEKGTSVTRLSACYVWVSIITDLYKGQGFCISYFCIFYKTDLWG